MCVSRGGKPRAGSTIVCACAAFCYVFYSGFPSGGFRPLFSRYRTAIIILIMRAAVTHARRMAKAQRANIEWLIWGGGSRARGGGDGVRQGAPPHARGACARGSASHPGRGALPRPLRRGRASRGHWDRRPCPGRSRGVSDGLFGGVSCAGVKARCSLLETVIRGNADTSAFPRETKGLSSLA